jgi:hypothetical protein
MLAAVENSDKRTKGKMTSWRPIERVREKFYKTQSAKRQWSRRSNLEFYLQNPIQDIPGTNHQKAMHIRTSPSMDFLRFTW